MNKTPRRRPTSAQQRGLHKITRESHYGFAPIVLQAAPVMTKKNAR